MSNLTVGNTYVLTTIDKQFTTTATLTTIVSQTYTFTNTITTTTTYTVISKNNEFYISLPTTIKYTNGTFKNEYHQVIITSNT